MNLRFLSILSGMLLLNLFFVFGCSESFDQAKHLHKNKEIVTLFKNELQSNLLKAVQERGPENSIEVCSEVSPKMEERISEEHSLQIRRVSTKFRNPNHEPDEWEKEVLEKWKKDLEEGKSITTVSELRNAEFRIMNPIVLENPTCLKCHGNSQEIDSKTLQKINAKYLNDKAKDYKLGELRGAFTSKWKI